MENDIRRQAIEAAAKAMSAAEGHPPWTAMDGTDQAIYVWRAEKAIDAYEAAMRDAFKESMRQAGTLYRPPPHQIQLQDSGAVHWATLPQDPETKP